MEKVKTLEDDLNDHKEYVPDAQSKHYTVCRGVFCFSNGIIQNIHISPFISEENIGYRTDYLVTSLTQLIYFISVNWNAQSRSGFIQLFLFFIVLGLGE